MSDSIIQKILPKYPDKIPLRTCIRRYAGPGVAALRSHLGAAQYVGIAAMRSPTGRLELLALASIQEILVITDIYTGKPPGLIPCDQSFEQLLRGEICTLAGFEMARLALLIAYDTGLRVSGVDLSTAFEADTRKHTPPSDIIATRIFPAVNKAAVHGVWNEDNGHREVCLRAWLSACIAESITINLVNLPKLDTSNINTLELRCLGELVRETCILEAAQPKEVHSEFTSYKASSDGTVHLQNSRYKTRVKNNNRQTVIMTNEDGREFYGQAHGAKGRTTNIRFNGQTLSGKLQKVRVFGQPALTNAETARDELLLLVLQGKTFLRSIFIRKLWYPNQGDRLPRIYPTPSIQFPDLNASQKSVALKMISDSPLVIAHGPPGTGKTTTIAAAVAVWAKNWLPTWIVAHSNVAVKNIAEKLFEKGVDFKIVVSKEFHFEWHEHIYHLIEGRVLRSDEFMGVKDIVGLEGLLGGSCVILSTLSMLSNPTLDRLGLFSRAVPVERLVIDEASQIKIEDFMYVFHRFSKSLTKVCFFGDPKQLPPFGQDQVPEMRTIFDLEYLEAFSEFLDTQYRMPAPLGYFISKYVYSGRLKSEHSIKDCSCVSFVDARNGEEVHSGLSWTNNGEIQVMVHLVRTYYKNKKFCIITPYDAQRAAIERQLKAEDLPWECVFNVDSFQGNEADFVLVSVVRSGSGPGFLTSVNRMNVLLTRCKKGLVIVTGRYFLQSGGGRGTLLGALERHWATINGDSTWVDWRAISEGTADLPGAPGPNRLNVNSMFVHAPGAGPASPHHVPQRRFDVKSLFRSLPKIESVAPLPSDQATRFGSLPSNVKNHPKVPQITPLYPVSSKPHSHVHQPDTQPSWRPSGLSMAEYLGSLDIHPPHYEIFPRLSAIDVPRQQSGTVELSPHSLWKGNQEPLSLFPPKHNFTGGPTLGWRARVEYGKPRNPTGLSYNSHPTAAPPANKPTLGWRAKVKYEKTRNPTGPPISSQPTTTSHTVKQVPPNHGQCSRLYRIQPTQRSTAAPVWRLQISDQEIARVHKAGNSTLAWRKESSPTPVRGYR